MKFILNQEGIKKITNNAERALAKTALKYESILRNEVPKDLGDTAKSVEAIKISNTTWRVGSNKVSANVLEFGRKPGKMPPSAVLIGWVSRKAGFFGNRTATSATVKGEDASKLKGLAFVIARSIGRKGIKPRYVFSKARGKYGDYIYKYFYSLMKEGG